MFSSNSTVRPEMTGLISFFDSIFWFLSHNILLEVYIICRRGRGVLVESLLTYFAASIFSIASWYLFAKTYDSGAIPLSYLELGPTTMTSSSNLATARKPRPDASDNNIRPSASLDSRSTSFKSGSITVDYRLVSVACGQT